MANTNRLNSITLDKEAWLTDLETTKALQGTNYLAHKPSPESETEFCCLGRGCVVVGLEMRLEEINEDGYEFIGTYKNGKHFAFSSIIQFSFMSEEQVEACTTANDLCRWSFAEIAEWWRETDGAVVEDEFGRCVPDYVLKKDR